MLKMFSAPKKLIKTVKVVKVNTSLLYMYILCKKTNIAEKCKNQFLHRFYAYVLRHCKLFESGCLTLNFIQDFCIFIGI